MKKGKKMYFDICCLILFCIVCIYLIYILVMCVIEIDNKLFIMYIINVY